MELCLFILNNLHQIIIATIVNQFFLLFHAGTSQPVWVSSLQNKTKRSNLRLDFQSENQRKSFKMGSGWSGSTSTDLKPLDMYNCKLEMLVTRI